MGGLSGFQPRISTTPFRDARHRYSEERMARTTDCGDRSRESSIWNSEHLEIEPLGPRTSLREKGTTAKGRGIAERVVKNPVVFAAVIATAFHPATSALGP